MRCDTVSSLSLSLALAGRLLATRDNHSPPHIIITMGSVLTAFALKTAVALHVHLVLIFFHSSLSSSTGSPSVLTQGKATIICPTTELWRLRCFGPVLQRKQQARINHCQTTRVRDPTAITTGTNTAWSICLAPRARPLRAPKKTNNDREPNRGLQRTWARSAQKGFLWMRGRRAS